MIYDVLVIGAGHAGGSSCDVVDLGLMLVFLHFLKMIWELCP